mgnify:FL=1
MTWYYDIDIMPYIVVTFGMVVKCKSMGLQQNLPHWACSKYTKFQRRTTSKCSVYSRGWWSLTFSIFKIYWYGLISQTAHCLTKFFILSVSKSCGSGLIDKHIEEGCSMYTDLFPQLKGMDLGGFEDAEICRCTGNLCNSANSLLSHGAMGLFFVFCTFYFVF